MSFSSDTKNELSKINNVKMWIFVHTRMDEKEKARGRSLDL